MVATDQLTDLTLTCPDCGETFTRTVAEQRYYAGRSLAPPETCPACRARRRAERNAEMLAAFSGNDRGSQRGVSLFGASAGFGGDRGGGGRSGGRNDFPKRLYRAVCAACGKGTEVPFEPRQDRPVYCRSCYNARKGY